MALSVTCSNCDRSYTFSDDKAGKRFQCKDCGSLVTVPAAEVIQAELVDDFWEENEDEDSPYAPPRTSSRTRKKRGKAGWLVTGLPAIFLIGASVIGMFFVVIQGIVMLATDERPRRMGDAEAVGYFVGIALFMLISVVSNIIVLLGSYHLLNRKSYKTAMMGAVVACIPCLTPCVLWGLPLGIWGLVVLLLDDVKRSFES